MLILIGSDSILYKILTRTSGKCTLIHSGVFRASGKGPRSCGYIITMCHSVSIALALTSDSLAR